MTDLYHLYNQSHSLRSPYTFLVFNYIYVYLKARAVQKGLNITEYQVYYVLEN